MNKQSNRTNNKRRNNYNKSQRNDTQKSGNESSSKRFLTKYREMEESKTGENDFAWYNKYPQVLSAANRIPFTFATGDQFPGTNQHTHYGNFQANAMPGIMVLRTATTWGSESSADSALNISARQLFNVIRANMSGTSYFDATDLMLYIGAMSEIHSWFAELRRVYGLMMTATPENRYYPRHLVEALGFNYDDLSHHLPEFQMFYNLSAQKLSAFILPSEMELTRRRKWMSEGIFLDGATIKSQTYAFVPDCYYMYNETLSQTGGMLYAVQHPSNYWGSSTGQGAITYDKICQYTAMMLEPIIGSADMQYISAAIKKVFGDNTQYVPAIAANYVTVPVYSREVLSQIENATIVYKGKLPSYLPLDKVPTAYDDIHLALVQDQSDLKKGPFLTYKEDFIYKFLQPPFLLQSETLLNLHDSESNEDATIASRLVTLLGPEVSPGVNKLVFGTEIVVDVLMYTMWYKDDGTVNLTYSSAMQQYVSVPDEDINFNGVANLLTTLQTWTTFDWAPKLVIGMTNTGKDKDKTYSFCDYSHVAFLNADTLDNLNKAILLSLFSS